MAKYVAFSGKTNDSGIQDGRFASSVCITTWRSLGSGCWTVTVMSDSRVDNPLEARTTAINNNFKDLYDIIAWAIIIGL